MAKNKRWNYHKRTQVLWKKNESRNKSTNEQKNAKESALVWSRTCISLTFIHLQIRQNSRCLVVQLLLYLLPNKKPGITPLPTIDARSPKSAMSLCYITMLLRKKIEISICKTFEGSSHIIAYSSCYYLGHVGHHYIRLYYLILMTARDRRMRERNKGRVKSFQMPCF